MAKKNIIRTRKQIASMASKILRRSSIKSNRSVAAAALSNRRRHTR